MKRRKKNFVKGSKSYQACAGAAEASTEGSSSCASQALQQRSGSPAAAQHSQVHWASFLHGVLKSAQTAATDRAFSISKHAVAYLGLHFFPLHRNHIISTSLLHEQYFQSQRGAERNQLKVGKKNQSSNSSFLSNVIINICHTLYTSRYKP